MADITRQQVENMLDVLRNFPANAQLYSIDSDLATDLVLYGFVERREVEKPCPTCGTKRFDYSFFKITPAGRALLALVPDRAALQTTQGDA